MKTYRADFEDSRGVLSVRFVADDEPHALDAARDWMRRYRWFRLVAIADITEPAEQLVLPLAPP